MSYQNSLSYVNMPSKVQKKHKMTQVSTPEEIFKLHFVKQWDNMKMQLEARIHFHDEWQQVINDQNALSEEIKQLYLNLQQTEEQIQEDQQMSDSKIILFGEHSQIREVILGTLSLVEIYTQE